MYWQMWIVPSSAIRDPQQHSSAAKTAASTLPGGTMSLISSSAKTPFFTRLCLLLLPLLVASLVCGQTAAPSAVPSMVRYNGSLKDSAGVARTGVVGVTFAVYRDEHGGAPLWMETQNVQADRTGAYTVELGASKSSGLPHDLFISGEARWLGVQPEGQPEQARVLLLSVPYALKAGDAETIGGLPPSAFVLAAPANAVSSASGAASSENAPPPASNVTTAGGTVNTIPLFSTGTDIENSAITQTGSGTSAKIGIATTTPATTLDVKGGTTLRGTLSLGATGAATAAGGKSSQAENLAASSFNSSTSSAVSQTFQFKAEPTGNNTASPSGTLNLLFGSGTASPTETGFKFASNGQITFASGQTFPGTGTISGVTAGSGLSGGGTSGNVTLKLLTTCATNQVLQWNGSAWVCASVGTGTITTVTAGTDLTGGGSSGAVTLNVDTSKVPQLSAANNFTANQTVTGNLTTTGTETAGFFNTNGTYNIGNAVFARGNATSANASVGFAGLLSATGAANTAVGDGALLVDTSGAGNTAVGDDALVENDSGAGNTAVGQGSLEINVKGSFNTAIGWLSGVTVKDGSFNTGLGYFAGPDFSAEGISNSTAVGAYADVSVSNALVLGSINGVNNATADTNVGIGTTAPSSALDVEGTAAADSAPNLLLKNKALIQTGLIGNAVDIRFAPDLGSSVGNPNAFIRVREDGSSQYGASMSFGTMADGGAGTGPIERMRILSTGNVGIGTSTPDSLLSVNGSADKTGGGSWGTFSDGRLKDLHGNFEAGLNEVLKLKPVRYQYKQENALGIHDSAEHVGFVAQDVQKVIPEAVTTNSRGYLMVNNDPILWAMLNAIRDQQQEIAQLKSQLKRDATAQAHLASRVRQLESEQRAGNYAAASRHGSPQNNSLAHDGENAAVKKLNAHGGM
jgi:hypothetical protein